MTIVDVLFICAIGLFIYFVWLVIGCAVLSQLDDESGSLLLWAKQCPLGGFGGFLTLWPVVMFYFLPKGINQ